MELDDEIIKEKLKTWGDIPLFKSFSKNQLMNIYVNSSIVKIKQNELILQEKEKIENIYLVEKGFVYLTKSVEKKNKNILMPILNKNPKTVEEIKIIKILPTSYFGSLKIGYEMEFNIKSGNQEVFLRLIPISFFLKNFETSILKEMRNHLKLKNFLYLSYTKKNINLKNQFTQNYYNKSATLTKRFSSLALKNNNSKKYLQISSFLKRKNQKRKTNKLLEKDS